MKTKCDCLNPVLSFMMKQCFFSQINLTNNNAKQRFHICFRWGSQIFKLLKATKKMHFDTHITTKFIKVIKQSFNNFFAFWRFGIAQKVIYNLAESDPTVFSSWFIVSMNYLSFMSCRIFGPSNTPAFIFSWLKNENFWQIYLKHSPPLSKLFTYCFIKPSLM